MKNQINLLTGEQFYMYPSSSGGSSSPLVDIQKLAGTAGNVSPGGYYEISTNGTFTLGVEGAIQGKAGSAMIDITLGEGGTITGASGLEIVSELKPSKINHCCVQIKNLSAQLWCYWTEDLP